MDRITADLPQKVLVTILDDEEKPVAADELPTFTSVYLGTATPGPQGTATAGPSDGEYYLPMTAAIGTLRVTVTATVASSEITMERYVEVARNRMFTLHELRRYDSALSNKSFAALTKARDAAERIFERETGQSFIVRQAIEDINESWGGLIEVSNYGILELSSYTVDGETYSYVELDPDDSQQLYADPHTEGTVRITYLYGMTSTPVDAKDAALKLARDIVLGSNSRLDDRAYALNIPDIGTVNLATPGERGSRTGIPEVDVVLEDYDIRPGGIR